MSNKFEIMAKLHGLDVNKNEHNYLNPTTEMCHSFYAARQKEIDDLKQEVCDMTFAAKAFEHLLDKKNVVEKEAVAV